MALRCLEIVINSAKDLKDVNLFSKMDVYAVSMINNSLNLNNSSDQKTTIDENGGTNPKWVPDLPMTFIIDVKEAMWLTLVIKLKAHGTLGDKDVGEVHVPMKNLLDNCGGAKDAKHMSCSVRTPDGKAKGALDFSFKFGYGGYPAFVPAAPYGPYAPDTALATPVQQPQNNSFIPGLLAAGFEAVAVGVVKGIVYNNLFGDGNGFN
ncbi:protein SRC2 homolog [Quercus lobata]|uniref:protein SRC2 homolog n=1 Tax=Quercus lobata TaxID=97700 RepID=UPI0012453935|nr:protein SRC2 homolog [Quercus lobata]